MDCMRINCAHDNEDAWASMVEKLRRAERELNKECRVLMDVPGPKLRTGPIESVPGVMKWSPRRDRFGTVTEPAKIWLTPIEHPESSPESADARLTVPAEWLNGLCDGDTIKFLDARGLSRSMVVTRRVGSSRLAQSAQTSYVTGDTILHVVSGRGTSRKLTDTSRIRRAWSASPADYSDARGHSDFD